MNNTIYDEAKHILIEMEDDTALKQLESLKKNKSCTKFKICVAGGFSRGKTHLINQLLNTGMFPEDVVPSTTVLTETEFGDPASLVFVGLEDKKVLEPTSDNMEKFCAGNEFADAEGIIRVGYPAQFLKPNLVVYDTPGIDDILARRADITFHALENCDSALVVTSANSPLGLNERQFIKSYLCNRHIPKIALVVTFLDQLNDEQAKRQLENISNTARLLFPGVEIWTALNSAATAICSVCGIENMRLRLREWSQDPELMNLREKRDMAALEQILNFSRSIQEAYLQNLSGDHEKRQDKLRLAERELRDHSESWNDLRNAFMDRGIVCAEKLQSKIGEMGTALKEEAARGNSSEFAAILREKARHIQDAICEMMGNSLHEDKAVLLGGLREKYDFIPDLQTNVKISPAHDVDISGFTGTASGLNGTLWEVLDFLQKHVDEISSVLPLPPLPRQIARKVANEILERGKQILSGYQGDTPDTDMEIDRFCGSLEKETMVSTRQVYAEIAEQVRKSQMKWLEQQRRELSRATGSDETEVQMEKCRHNISAVDALLAKIKAEI